MNSMDHSHFEMPSSDSNFSVGDDSSGFYDGCSERKKVFRGLDVVGYVPGLGSISGVVRATIAKVAELWYSGAAAIKNPFKKDSDSRKAKNASYEFKAKYYSREAKRGALEIIPFASIVYDCKVKSHETDKKNDEDTLAFGRFYRAGRNEGMDFAFTGGMGGFKNEAPRVEEI